MGLRLWMMVCGAWCVFLGVGTSAQAQGRIMVTVSSGDWNDDIWRSSADPEDTRPPTAEDSAFISLGHDVTFSGQATGRMAEEIGIYGRLSLPTPEEGEPGSTLWARRIVVRGGTLNAHGAHTIILEGDNASVLVLNEGARADLVGVEVLERGQVEALEAGAGPERLRVKIGAQSWPQDVLVGARVKLLDGLARLRSFEVVANEGQWLEVALDSRGAQPQGEPFEATPEGDARHVLVAPSDLIEVEPLGYGGRKLVGRWLERLDDGALFFATGAHDGEGDEPDRVVVWPPLQRAGTQRFAWTHGITAGDAVRISMPLRITLPPEHRLPVYSPERRLTVLSTDQTRLTLSDVDVRYGSVRSTGVDNMEEGEFIHLREVEIAYDNGDCHLALREMGNVVLEGLHVRDVHPGNDLVDNGGLWTADQQRGHGICYYGQNVVIRDNLVSGLNDDMIYVAASQNILIEGNLALNNGIFNGNSHENITLFDVSGEITVRGNVAMGSNLSVRVDTRAPDANILIEDNILAQDQTDAIASDHSQVDGDARPIVWRNNVFLNGNLRRMLFDGRSSPARLEHNLFFDITLFNVPSMTGNIVLGSGVRPGALLINPGQVHSNIISAPSTPHASALVLIVDGYAHPPELTQNTLDAGIGDAIHLETIVGAFERNIFMSRLAFVSAENVAADQQAPPIEDNLSTGPFKSSRAWLPIPESNTVADEIPWVNADFYIQDDGSPGFQGPDQLMGYIQAGLDAPQRLPLPLAKLPARLSSHCSLTEGGCETPPAQDPEPILPDPISPDRPSTPGRPVVDTPDLANTPSGCSVARSVLPNHRPTPLWPAFVALGSLLIARRRLG